MFSITLTVIAGLVLRVLCINSSSVPHAAADSTFPSFHCTPRQKPRVVKYEVDYRYTNQRVNQVVHSASDTDASYGFYYPTPWNRRETFFLSTERPGSPSQPVSLSLFVYSNTTKVKIGESTAFNTPEGCRLQWIGSTDFVTFNIRTDKGFGAVISEINFPFVRNVRELPVPIYSLSASGTMLATLNFARIFCLSSDGTYGYRATDPQITKELSTLIPDDDGIRIYDIDESFGVRERALITPQHVIDYLSVRHACLANLQQFGPWMSDYYVWFEQPKFSSNGNRVVFIARAKRRIPGDTLASLHVREYINLGMFTVDIDGGNLWYAEGYPVSHFDFVEDKLLLCGNDGMAVVRDLSGSGILYLSNALSADARADLFAGHCTFHPLRKHLILTDTSCTRCTSPCDASQTCQIGQRGRYVGVLDTKYLTLHVLGMFEVDISVPENAFVDLHPRFSPTGRKIMIDGQFTGRARQYEIDVEDVLPKASVAAVLFELHCDTSLVQALMAAVEKLPKLMIYITQTSVNRHFIISQLHASGLIDHDRIRTISVEHLVSSKSKGKSAMRRLLFTPQFWELFPEDYLLWFHADTFFCDGAQKKLEKLMSTNTYPYVGSPHQKVNAMVGGASLRDKETFRAVASMLHASDKLDTYVRTYEDLSFGSSMHLSPQTDKLLFLLGSSYFFDVKSPIPKSFQDLISLHFTHNNLGQVPRLRERIDQVCPGAKIFLSTLCARGNVSCLRCPKPVDV